MKRPAVFTTKKTDRDLAEGLFAIVADRENRSDDTRESVVVAPVGHGVEMRSDPCRWVSALERGGVDRHDEVPGSVGTCEQSTAPCCFCE
jgi:hypothetical protein